VQRLHRVNPQGLQQHLEADSMPGADQVHWWALVQASPLTTTLGVRQREQQQQPWHPDCPRGATNAQQQRPHAPECPA
jgi:hypothetical protein